ncbi:MAG: TonB-dependent receptor domain-containing protein [Chitinophagaceae bacterium]
MKPILHILTALGLTGLAFTAKAQESFGKINGTVQSTRKGIEKATVQLLHKKDSSIVKLIFSGINGQFEFEKVKKGGYLVAVQSIGFQKQYSQPFEISDKQLNWQLPIIELAATAKDLGNVTVVSQKQLIEQKLDKIVVNVDASPTNVGSTALEVLEKSPGISVDKDGNISLKGKQGVVILLDGKPSYLSGADLANLLRNLNSSQLDQIEIMTNPSAKYDAAGNSGIINIKTKKNKIKGLNGSITAGYGQGVYPKTNQNVSLNYRNGKWNLFSNYSFNYREGFQELAITRNFREKVSKDIVSVFDQEANMFNINRSHNLKLGADYFMNKKTTLGVVVTGFNSAGNFSSKNITHITDKNGVISNITQAINESNETWKNITTNFNIKHVFDTTGKELTADIDYARYDAGSFQPLYSHYYNAQGGLSKPSDTLLGSLPILINIYSAKADYIHPLKKGAKLEAGLKFSYVETDNNAKYDSLINNQLVPDYNRSNHFIYKENINAGYVNFSKQFSAKWSVQLGLRVENTHARGTQLGNVQRPGSSFDTSYTQLFPTAYVGYTINSKHQLGLNYGRRINRPSYEDLNPFIQFIDRYTFMQGNPYLRPQFSHNIELSHTFMGGLLNTTVNYTKVNNIIQQVLEQNSATNETYVKQQNIAQLDQFGLAISGNIPVKKWWNLNVYANVFNNRFRGIVGETAVDLSAVTLQTNINNSFKLGKGWNAELSGFLRTRGVEGVIIAYPMGVINMGVSKSVLNNKGTVRFNLRDPFLLQRFKGSSKYGDVDAVFTNRWDNRVANISFTYRFSKGKGAGAQRQRRSVDEISRIKIDN